MTSSTATTCPYCGVGCGVQVSSETDTPLGVDDVRVTGLESHPANQGRLCSKGSALADTLSSRDRIASPMVSGTVCSWDTALDRVADRMRECIDQHGRESVALYLSGQLLTEDYYVANKFMKGFIGTANVDTNSRLCMASAVVGHKRAFGTDSVPACYEDLEQADLVVLVGSNMAWTHPIVYQRLVAAKQARPEMRIILIDPRRTETAQIADQHLGITPGSDAYLFNGLMRYLIANNQLDREYIKKHTQGFAALEQCVLPLATDMVARYTGLKLSELETFYQAFASTEKTVTVFSQGINQSATGSDKCNAIINCHLATGRIGKVGASPFSITGQPNAMGGREVGGLANQLAAHMGFDDESCDRVQRFWNSPTIARQEGLKAVDLFNGIAEGKIKFVWIMATNPAVSLPNNQLVRDALEQCDTVVVSDVANSDTVQLADIVLPAQAWSEKDGTVTNSERTISRQRRFRAPYKEAREDWWAICQVAQRMGWAEHFAYQSAADIFREHAALSAFENEDVRQFNLGGLAELSNQQFDQFAPLQWPVTSAFPSGRQRLFSDGCYDTESGKANFIAVQAAPAVAHSKLTSECSFVLNTGRIRDQWHTMNRTSQAANLNLHQATPFVEMHPQDAVGLGLLAQQVIMLSNSYGRAAGRLLISDKVAPGNVFAPIHWSYSNSSHGLVNQLFSSLVDPHSGQPESKASAVRVTPFEAKQWAVVVTQQAIDTSPFCYWANTRLKDAHYYLLGVDKSDEGSDFDWQSFAKRYTQKGSRQTSYSAPDGGQQMIFSSEQKIEMLIFCAANHAQLPSSVWLNDAFQQSADRVAMLIAGESGAQDALVCSCFSTTQKTIVDAIESGQAATLESLSASLGCGSKCGSCRPELEALIEASQIQVEDSSLNPAVDSAA